MGQAGAYSSPAFAGAAGMEGPEVMFLLILTTVLWILVIILAYAAYRMMKRVRIAFEDITQSLTEWNELVLALGEVNKSLNVLNNEMENS